MLGLRYAIWGEEPIYIPMTVEQEAGFALSYPRVSTEQLGQSLIPGWDLTAISISMALCHQDSNYSVPTASHMISSMFSDGRASLLNPFMLCELQHLIVAGIIILFYGIFPDLLAIRIPGCLLKVVGPTICTYQVAFDFASLGNMIGSVLHSISSG